MTIDLQAHLMQTIAARYGLSTDARPEELLAHVANGDPKIALLANFLTQRNVEQHKNDDIADDIKVANAVEPDPEEIVAGQEHQSRIRAKIELLNGELELLRERNDTLAAALGACYLCWGTDPLCQHCDGSGLPGASAPDKELFERIITPALRRLWGRGPRRPFVKELSGAPAEFTPRERASRASNQTTQ